MALAPEFFVLLGIVIFLALSVICALLERHLSSILQYMFQAASAVGLGELLLSQGLPLSTRVWTSIVYLAFALSSVVGVNIRLAIVRRKMSIASIFSQMVTVPLVMVSALFLSSFLENGGELVFSSASILTIATLILVASLSIFGLLREYSKLGGVETSVISPLSIRQSQSSIGAKGPSFTTRSPPSGKDWEESPSKEKD